MSDELLSALMDGQCSKEQIEQVLAALESSPELKRRWSRMALAREALAGTRVIKAAPDFASSVMAAIDAEDAAIGNPNPKVVPLRRVAAPTPAVVSAAPRRTRRWQPIAGLAAAASITAAVVISGGSLLGSSVSTVNAPAQLARATAAQSGATAPASVGTEIAETRWNSIDAAAARQLNDFLMEHSNSRSEAGMGGSLSYARLAVRSADYRPATEPR